jgi:hypothetical protein
MSLDVCKLGEVRVCTPPSLTVQHAQPVSKHWVEWNCVQMQQYCCRQKSKHLYGMELGQTGHEKSLQQWAPAALAVPGASVAPRPSSANAPSFFKNLLRLEFSLSARTADVGSWSLSLTDPPSVSTSAP